MRPHTESGITLQGLGPGDIARAAASVRASPDPEGVIRSLVKELHEITLRDVESALERSELLVEIADRGAPAPARVAARCARAHVLSVANRFENALAVLDEAMELATAAQDDLARAHVEHNAVQPLARLGRLSDAVLRAERAVELFERLSDRVSAAKAHSNLAVIHRMRDDPVRALHHFELAIPPLRDTPAIAAQLESNRAEAMLDIADFTGAERAFRCALDAFEAAGAAHAAAVVEGNLADLLGRQGRLESALRHFERAGAAFGSGGSGDAARLEAERAEVLASIGLTSDAKDAWLDAIAALDSAAMPREAARARIGLSSLLVRVGQSERAESLARAAAESLTRIGSTHGLAAANSALARAMIARGRIEQGESLLIDAIGMLRDRPPDAAASIHTLVEVLLGSGRVDEAVSWIDRGVTLAEGIHHPVLLASFLHARGRAYAALGRTREAAEQLRGAIEQVERLRGGFMGDRLRAAWLGDRSTVYMDLARLELARGGPSGVEAAFTAIDQSRSRSLLDMVRGGAGLAEHVVAHVRSPEEQGLLEKLTAKRGELNAIFSWMGQRTGRVADDRRASLTRRIPPLEREIASLEGRLAATRRYAEIFGLPATLGEVQAALDPRTSLVSYFELDGHVGAFVVIKDGVRAMPRLCEAKTLAEASARLAFQIDRSLATVGGVAPGRSDRLLDHTQRELRTLYNFLIRPLAPMLREVDRLVVIPYGPMHSLPFAALLGDDGYLVERWTTTILPSASLFEAVASAARSAPPVDRALVIGVADEVAPRIRDEALLVSRRLERSTLLLDGEATVERVAREAAGSDIIHLCCHGVFPPGQPMQSRVRLGDRWMSAREAFSLNLPGSSVILSCCEGGRNALGSGGEILGLARALLAAGATSMIGGLWAAHDDATLELFSHFYNAMTAETTPTYHPTAASLLASAQRRLMTQRPHPAFWATFACVGAP